MAKGKREKAGIIVEKIDGRPVLASAFDAEEFAALPNGAQFDLIPRAKRSLPQHRLYWAALNVAVKATARWPSATHLHEALKRDLGYTHLAVDLAGNPYVATDPTDFDSMTQDEFQEFFTRATSRLIEAVKFDPLEVIANRRRAA